MMLQHIIIYCTYNNTNYKLWQLQLSSDKTSNEKVKSDFLQKIIGLRI